MTQPGESARVQDVWSTLDRVTETLDRLARDTVRREAEDEKREAEWAAEPRLL